MQPLPMCAPPPAVRAGAWQRRVARWLRPIEAVLRGPVDVAFTIAVFVAAGAVGGGTGLAVAGGWLLLSGLYCVLNFWLCRETHCVVTGAGWTLLGLLGLLAATAPILPWYRVDIELAGYLVVLAAGYALQCAVTARTGRRTLTRGGVDSAQAC